MSVVPRIDLSFARTDGSTDSRGGARDAATPLAAALDRAFRFLLVVAAVLLVAWLTSGIRLVEPGTQAVILRLGAIDRVTASGLATAWPRPLEEVLLVPGPERQLSQAIQALDLAVREDGTAAPAGVIGLDPRRDGGYALTGDAGVVHLRMTAIYAVSDARRYVLQPNVVPALQRVVLAATIAGCAQRSLDGVMVASPDTLSQQQNEAVAQSRERLRGDIVADANRRLERLGCGITVNRIDVTAYLPARAKPSFDAVIAAESAAAKDIAEARTAATARAQETQNACAGILAAAEAKAQETQTAARVATDPIRAVLAENGPQRRQLLIARIYGERIGTILRNAGGVVSVPDGQPARIYLPGR
jgi:regulator of protease activity HflC (stomatin/prohibitin superfamily)